jgi:competence protein ComEA
MVFVVSNKRFLHPKAAAWGLMLCLLFAAAAVSAQTAQREPAKQQAQPQDVPALPDGPGKDTVIELCSGCHAPDNVVLHGQSRDDWEGTLSRMVAYGMVGTDDQMNEILDYLAKNFPKPPASKINPNKATAVELELALGLSTKEAKTIVEYREKNGEFKSFDDLKKVPDVDAKKLADKKDRLVF